MSGLRHRRLAGWFTAGVVGLALVIGGCGDDDDSDIVRQDNQTPQATSGADGSGASLSSVAPNTFLTFEGRRYRLVNLEQADFVDESALSEVGEATEADIDQDDLAVYQKSGDSEAVYTYAAAQSVSPDASAGEGRDQGTPALWYRWLAEP